jgi:hypothetical protein
MLPKMLADLKSQPNVIHLRPGVDMRLTVNSWFKDAGFDGAAKINHLFDEGGVKVYESYVDSGSVDYLYIIVL